MRLLALAFLLRSPLLGGADQRVRSRILAGLPVRTRAVLGPVAAEFQLAGRPGLGAQALEDAGSALGGFRRETDGYLALDLLRHLRGSVFGSFANGGNGQGHLEMAYLLVCGSRSKTAAF